MEHPTKLLLSKQATLKTLPKWKYGTPTGYRPDSFANFVASQLGLPANSLTDTDVIGTNRVERQIFFRSQFTY
jgi:hypothetical protein